MASALGHADRRTAFRSYCVGLILPGERKSVAPIAARLEPRRVQGAHQSQPHFVANADWPQADFLRRVRTFVLPAIEKSGRIIAWIVDDTGFPKRGVRCGVNLGAASTWKPGGRHAREVPRTFLFNPLKPLDRYRFADLVARPLIPPLSTA